MNNLMCYEDFVYDKRLKNKNEIKGYIELTDYDGLMITK